jgi:triacylglycerol esterase/lipase EstA (alpha/beta hydrolase family)
VKRDGVIGAFIAVLLVGTPSPPVSGQVPVLLVPGWFDTERDLAALRIRLLSAGWPVDGVAALTFVKPTGSNEEHAEEIAWAVRTLRESTGAPKIDVVAHSMGGLAVRAYLRGVGSNTVRRVAFLGTPHRGTYSAYLAFGDGREEMIPGSEFLTSLNAEPSVPEGVEAMTIRTPIDALVLPVESAMLDGVPNHQICCPTHAGLLRSLDVYRVVRLFLAEGNDPGAAR